MFHAFRIFRHPSFLTFILSSLIRIMKIFSGWLKYPFLYKTGKIIFWLLSDTFQVFSIIANRCLQYFSDDTHTRTYLYIHIWCPKICLTEIHHPVICHSRKFATRKFAPPRKTHHRSSWSCMLGSNDIFIKWESQLATAIFTKKWVFYPGVNLRGADFLAGKNSVLQICLGGKFPLTN